MKGLIKITENNGQKAVSARDLHQFLESKQDFSTWIKNRIEKYDLVENVDYAVFHKFVENSNGGRPQIEYALTIDAAKELSMVEGNEKGKQARRYFIECEKMLKNPSHVLHKPDIDLSLKWIEGISRILNLNDSSKHQLLQKVATPLGLPMPEYIPSKGTLKSASQLLKELHIDASAQVFNRKMMEYRLLEEKTRPSTKGTKRYKTITGDGLQYGENQLSPANPHETQPLYYEERFPELLRMIGLAATQQTMLMDN